MTGREAVRKIDEVIADMRECVDHEQEPETGDVLLWVHDLEDALATLKLEF